MTPYRIALSAVTLSFIGAGASWADDIQAEALKFAEAQNYDAAIALLDAATETSTEDLSRALLKARLLSWQGITKRRKRF